MDQEIKQLLSYLEELKKVVTNMSNLYEAYPNLNDQVDIQRIVPMSLDEWAAEIPGVIEDIEKMQKP